MNKEHIEHESQGYRLNARAALRERIQRLRSEADGLEALLLVLSPLGNEDRMSPEADEALWKLVITR